VTTVMRLTPQLSRRALRCPARSKRIMKWRACAHVSTYDGRLELLVSRHAYVSWASTFSAPRPCGFATPAPLPSNPR
jgi:hypothetical protein